MYPWGPSVKEIHRYRSKDDILRVIKHEMWKDVEAIRAEKGELRQIVMDVLYRAGGLKSPQNGRIFGLDYGSMSLVYRDSCSPHIGDRFMSDVVDMGIIDPGLFTSCVPCRFDRSAIPD